MPKPILKKSLTRKPFLTVEKMDLISKKSQLRKDQVLSNYRKLKTEVMAELKKNKVKLTDNYRKELETLFEQNPQVHASQVMSVIKFMVSRGMK